MAHALIDAHPSLLCTPLFSDIEKWWPIIKELGIKAE
jgi:hypothetical protein